MEVYLVGRWGSTIENGGEYGFDGIVVVLVGSRTEDYNSMSAHVHRFMFVGL